MVAKQNLAWALVLLICCVLDHVYFACSAHRPNIVLILLDDVGYGDLGCYWNPSGQLSNTPFLDYMADNGIRFTDFHSAGSLCAPSRGSLLTGRLCIRNGFPGFLPEGFVGGLPLSETTFGETFKTAGYRTGMIGKWGLGITERYHPNSRGFDFFFGLPDSNNFGCTLEAGATYYPDVCPRNWSDTGGDSVSPCSLSVALLYNRTVVEQPVNQTSLSLRYAEMAAQFVQNGTNPYLLYVGLAHMHVPLFHMPEFEGRSESNSVYGDTLLEMDNTIKTIVEAIKESGEEENTLVWVVSDNGPNEYECEYGGSLGPFTGTWQREQGGGGGASKGSVYEAGHRVPSIVYWPGIIKGGQVSDALTTTMDIYPTMAALANIQMPDKRIYDGVDISDLLMGTPALPRRVLFHPTAHIVDGQSQCVIDAVRKDDYKAIFTAGGYRACGVGPGIRQSYSPPLIFNVKEDPMESSPLDPDSDLFRSVLEQVNQALVDIHHTLKLDKTTIQEGEYDPCSLPCCNPLNVVCRCN